MESPSSISLAGFVSMLEQEERKEASTRASLTQKMKHGIEAQNTLKLDHNLDHGLICMILIRWKRSNPS